MRNAKICPLMSKPEDIVVREVKCREDKCAWWAEEIGKCVVFVSAQNVINLPLNKISGDTREG